ncbi:MAG TPA: uracil-DNA glycosylase, partial [Candidatus Latescibacteria bacterium]|nr:uracil-DNA glycosylase [Candidatus Latescibacterota bacterium]
SMRELRGRLHQYEGVPVIVTYHPSYLLRTPSAKRDVWEDVKRLRREFDGVEL